LTVDYLVVVLQTILVGLLLGGLYAATGAGLSLVFGVSGILNAAHGEFLMLGAFGTYWLIRLANLDAILTMPVVFALVFALGAVLQFAVLNRTIGAAHHVSLLVTFGLSMVIVNSAQLLWSADHRMITVPYLQRSALLGPFVLPLSRLVAFTVGVGMVLGLYALLEWTRLGRMIRATAQDWEAARMLGVNPYRISAVSFALGAGITGVAGSLVALSAPVEPHMGLTQTLFAFAVVVLGGLGYVPGVLVGGIALGLVQAVTETYLDAGLSFFAAFLLLFLMLRFMPAGVMGRGRME
jgi:branched-chain amino acid transport system permease protein